MGKTSTRSPVENRRARGRSVRGMLKRASWLRAAGGWKRFGVAAMFALLVASCTTQAPRTTGAWQTVRLGLCEDYPEETRTLEKARLDLAHAHEAGAQVLRIAFGWDSMEPERGRYDWSFWDDFVRAATQDYGIQLIPYVCYTPKWAASDQGENYWRSPPRHPEDFGRFVAALVTRYGGRIHTWELWNEPDNQAYWTGTPQQFAALVRAGSAAVRRTDPAAKVVLGGIAGELDFLAKVLRDEHVSQVVDVVNVHTYFETWHPNRIEQLPNYLESAAGLIRDSGGHQPLWLAELGYSSVNGREAVSSVYRAHYAGEHTDAAQAAALVRMGVTALATRTVSLIAWYRINDLPPGQDVIGDDNNRHLGVRAVNGAPKPAFGALRLLARLFAGPYEVVPVSVAPDGQPNEDPQVHAFRLRDGRYVVAAWLALPETPSTHMLPQDPRQATLTLLVPGAQARRVALQGADGRPLAVAANAWRVGGRGTELTWTLRGGEVLVAELSP